jgi:hypothetical protein
MKIIGLEEYIDFATLTTDKLFSKLKSHELSKKSYLNHDASFTSCDVPPLERMVSLNQDPYELPTPKH